MNKKFFLVALACLVVVACARKPVVETTGALEQERWQQYLAVCDAAKPEPYRLQMSLRFGNEGDSRRVTALAWGNDTSWVRLDVMAGMGVTVAKIMQDGEHFLVFDPRNNKAYFHQGANKPLLKIGVPLPFDLGQLTALLCGQYAGVFGRESVGMSGAAHALPGDATLTLDNQGRPVAWAERNGWQMELGHDDDGLPTKVRLTHPNGKKAIVLVKEREKPAPFAAEQLRIALTPGTDVLPLAKYQYTGK